MRSKVGKNLVLYYLFSGKSSNVFHNKSKSEGMKELVENIMYNEKIQHVQSRKVSIYQVEYWKLAKYINGVKRS